MPGLPDHEAWRRFSAAPVARLGTVSTSGAPHVVPTVFTLTDRDEVVTAIDHKPKSTRRLARLAHIRHEPRVTLLVDRYDDDWTRLWWVRVDGVAQQTDDPPGNALRALASKYPQYQEHPPEGPFILVAVEKISGWEARS